MEANIQMILPQAKENQELPDAGRGKKGAFGGTLALPIP